MKPFSTLTTTTAMMQYVGIIAASHVSDETIIKKMSQRMQELMPARMGEMGLQATVTKVYIYIDR
jgi:hypothetical protein